jgi:hypothetical protein
VTEVRNHVIELLAIFAGPSRHLVRAGLRHRDHRRPGLGRDGLEDPAGHVHRVRCPHGVLVAKGLSMLKQGKLAFPETMKELRNDRDMLL